MLLYFIPGTSTRFTLLCVWIGYAWHTYILQKMQTSTGALRGVDLNACRMCLEMVVIEGFVLFVDVVKDTPCV